MISEETIMKIKDAAKISEVVGAFVKLTKEGKELIACCPFHDEKTPSFKVSSAKGIYKCFGCGRSGDGIAFLMQNQNMGYIQAIEWIAKKYGIEIEEYQKREIVKPVGRLEKLGSKSLNFLEKARGISNYTLLRFGITESIEFMQATKKNETVICFNYFRDGELVNIKFRGPQKSFQLSKDAELILYNLDAIKDEKECIITEGEIDCLSFHEAGICNVVSVPNGAAIGVQKLEYMDNCWGYFLNKEKVYLAVDNDTAGNGLRNELARRIGYEKCFQITYPEKCKDANDVLLKHGKDAIKDLITKAISWPVDGLVTSEEWETEVDSFYEEGYPEGSRSRIPGFDELLTFYPGQLTVITGTPGSGKSEFVDYIMTSLSMLENWKWGICSFETKPSFHVSKLAEKITQKAFDFRKNLNYRMNEREFKYAKDKIKDSFHFVNISLVDITMDGLIAKAEELVKRKGINGFLLDPWNCIEEKYEGEMETKYILQCLNKLIHFLEKYNVHGFLVAHPIKLSKDQKTHKYPIPTLYNIAGSAHFFNRTHNGMSIVRDMETNLVDVYVQKVKYSWLGRVGFCSFHYNTMTRQYTVLNETNETINEDLKNSLPPGTWNPIQLPYADDKPESDEPIF